MSGTEMEEVAPSLKLEKLVRILNDPENAFGHKIDLETLKTVPKTKILSAGRGYASHVYKIDFEAEDGKCSVVAKIPSSSVATDELHTNEIAFFEMMKLIPESKDMKMPKYFYGQTNPESSFILMEDLTTKAEHSEFCGYFFLNDDQVKECILEICKLQALTFKAENVDEKIGKLSTLRKIFLAFMDQTLKTVKSMNLPFLTEERLEKLEKASKRTAEEKANSMNLPFLTEERLEKLEKASKRTAEEKANVATNLNYPLVLIHDDFWAGNLLFCNDGRLCSVIDWQLASMGCFAEDLAALLGMALNGKTRRAKEDQFLEFYHSELVKLLPKGHPEAEKLINMSKKDLRAAYNECQKSAIFRVMMTMNNYINDTTRPVFEEMLQSIVEDVFG
uniref:CHK kinase-like domain-containing protein n=1 Tax=Panagrolaimus sp. JU765 TaxID=591449 RepID=A0AC34QPN2_9BILA